jgi:hypothetical protein
VTGWRRSRGGRGSGRRIDGAVSRTAPALARAQREPGQDREIGVPNSNSDLARARAPDGAYFIYISGRHSLERGDVAYVPTQSPLGATKEGSGRRRARSQSRAVRSSTRLVFSRS